MRKIFFCLCIGLLMVTFFTVSAASNAEQLAKWKQTMADQKLPANTRFRAAVNVYFFSGENPAPTSYKDLKAKISEIGKKYNVSEAKVAGKIYQIVTYVFKDFNYEAWTEIKSSNYYFWKVHYATYWATDKITDTERFDALSESLPKLTVVNIRYISSGVDKLLSICPSMKDEAKVKSTLKKLNRIFTPKLLNDKSKWEPIVAKIRTTLETY